VYNRKQRNVHRREFRVHEARVVLAADPFTYIEPGFEPKSDAAEIGFFVADPLSDRLSVEDRHTTAATVRPVSPRRHRTIWVSFGMIPTSTDGLDRVATRRFPIPTKPLDSPIVDAASEIGPCVPCAIQTIDSSRLAVQLLETR
jgi:hypothetical protein